jgi:hypothetical protein
VLGRLLSRGISKISPSADDMRVLVNALLALPDASVLTEEFYGVLAVPNQVAPLLKKYPAVLYHFPSKSYRFYTPAYLHAARALQAANSRLLSASLPDVSARIEPTVP